MKLPARNGEIWLGDCLDLMKDIPSGSVDMILCDLPYGTTDIGWDAVIPFEALWSEYLRIAKSNTPILLFGAEPFSTKIRMSNFKDYKYDWYWQKSMPSGFANAKHQPMRVMETICVFYKTKPVFNPQLVPTKVDDRKMIEGRKNGGLTGKTNSKHFGHLERPPIVQKEMVSPRNLLEFKSVPNSGGHKLHPTQKPVALFEYLIKTYTNEGDTVLDNCIGSGTTAIAAENTGRRWIGIERDFDYFMKAWNRVVSHVV